MLQTLDQSAILTIEKMTLCDRQRIMLVPLVSDGTRGFLMPEKKEVWVDVIGYVGYYQVSNFGRVRSLDRVVNSRPGVLQSIKGRTLKPSHPTRPSLYLRVNLTLDGKITTTNVHKLVARAFVPNPHNKPCVNHKDGNKFNNHVDNLEWVTFSENTMHAYSSGLMKPFLNVGELNGKAKLTVEEALTMREMVDQWDGIKEHLIKDLAEVFSCSRTTIHGICKHAHWNV